MSNKTIYWIFTGLFSAMILMGVVMYFTQYEMVQEAYTKLGYPTYLIYPIAIAKTLGVAAIVSRKSEFLKEWAYAGFFFLLALGAFAHIQANDGEFGGALIALVLLIGSYVYENKAFQN